MTPRSHTESVLDVLYMDGKIISRIFQCTGFMPKFIRSQQKSSKQYDIQNVPGSCTTVFWAVVPCIVSGQVAQVVDAPLATTSNPRTSLRV